MIDTLKLSLSEFEIASEHDIIVQPSAYNPSTGEQQASYPLWHTGGRYIEGSRAFHNSEDFNLTIKPISPTEPDKVGCYVQFSVPKVATGSNYYPTDEKGTVEALETIQKQLLIAGVKTNIKTANLSRVDAFKTVQAQEPYQSYHGILAMLQGQRMAKRDYGTTFLWSNKSQEVCVYDKLAEMQQRKCDISRLPPNSIRFEQRWLKAPKVRDTLEMRTVADLLSNQDHVRDTYHRVMEKQLFKHSMADVVLFTSNQFVDEYNRLGLASNRTGFRRYLSAVALLRGFLDVEAVRQALPQIMPDRMMQSRIRRDLEQAMCDAAALRVEESSKRTMGQLYSELQAGVLSG
jgi:hypothetical protein